MKVRRIRWAYPSGNTGELVGRFLGPCCPSEDDGKSSLRFGWEGEPDDGKAIYIELTEPGEINGQVMSANSWWAGDPRGVYDDVESGRRMFSPTESTPGIPTWAADWLHEHKRWPKYAPLPPAQTKAPEPRVVRASVKVHVDFDLESIKSYLRPDGDYYDEDGLEIDLANYALESVRDALDDTWLGQDAVVCIEQVDAEVEGAHDESHEQPEPVPTGNGVQWEVRN